MNFSLDFLFVMKYINGIIAPKNWANAVAIAAHKIHNLNQYIKIKSNIIFDTHTAIETFNHRSGLSFTIKKLWKACCNIKNTNAINNILQYIIQFDNTSHDALSMLIIGPTKMNHITVKNIQIIIMKYTNIEKYLLANCRFFSQRVFEIKALPQLPTINPNEAIIIKTGNVRFTAVKASFQTKFETKTQSTTQ